MTKSEREESSFGDVVLVLAPTLNDSATAVEVLRAVGLQARAATDLGELADAIDAHCGALVIAEEAFNTPGLRKLETALERQETWSDVPILLMTGNDPLVAAEAFRHLGNVSLLERPFTRFMLIRAVQIALRARHRQFLTRQLLLDLRQSKEDAERASIAKTEFLANMSHEIRTPIGAILGFTDLLKNPDNTSEENASYTGIVERNSQQLLRLIDDILDLSKVEAGKMSIEQVEFSLSDLIADFASVMKLKAGERGIDFILTLESPIPGRIGSDPVRLKQIMNNLVGNALKFTERGFVELSLGYQEPQLTLTVRDTGVGISEEQRQKLFRAFAQADSSTTRRFGGTGLGLVLSRRLAEALGGGLKLTASAPGAGSTFTATVLVKPVTGTELVSEKTLTVRTARSALTVTTQALRGMKVLVVEDSPDNQTLIETYLRATGAEIRTANDGLEGREMALREHFDVVLMDVQMPRLDGHTATRSLRQARYGQPIIALTAHAMKEERVRCFESGFTDFLTKPLQRDLLIQVLSRYLPRANHY